MAIGPAEGAKMPKKNPPAGLAPEVYTFRDTAIILNTCPDYLSKEVKAKRIKSHKRGRFHMFTRLSINEYFAMVDDEDYEEEKGRSSMDTKVLEREVTVRRRTREKNPVSLQYARARAFDNAATRRLATAIKRKRETEAELKRLKMPL
jgi:hypothetical protein